MNDEDDFCDHVRTSDEGCWEWQGKRLKGKYGVTSKKAIAHRIAWQMTYGPIPPGMFVCHHCDNPPCCRPEHLFLGTNSDNQMDSSRKGRNTKGRKQDPEFVERRIAPIRGRVRSPEHCARLAASARRIWKDRPKPWLRGRKASLEARLKMSLARKGKQRPPEVCAAISAGQLGKKRRPLTDEHREKLSIALKGKTRRK